MKTKTKILLLTLLIAIFPASTNLASAHGPENFKASSCKGLNPGKWIPELGSCSIDGSSPNLDQGITHDTYDSGLCFPSFNNYLESYIYEFNDQGERVPAIDDQGRNLGIDPLASPLFVDERNFVQAGIYNENGNDWNDYGDSVTVKEGDILQVYFFMHNDGDPCYNLAPTTPDGFNWLGVLGKVMTTSLNTKLSFAPNPNTVETKFPLETQGVQFYIDKTTDMFGSIWSDNAINSDNIMGGVQANSINVTPENNTPLILEWTPSDSEFVFFDETPDGQSAYMIPITQTTGLANFFKSSGLPISTLKKGSELFQSSNFKRNNGDFYASEPYSVLLRFDFIVKAPPEEAPYCEDLTVSSTELNQTQIQSFTGQTDIPKMIKINGDSLTFTDGKPVPDDSEITIKTTDPNGTFWHQSLITGNIEPLPNTSITRPAAEFVDAGHFNSILYYSGTAPATITIEIAEPYATQECSKTLTFEYTPEPESCTQLLVNHQEPIVEGTTSKFEAKALDQDGKPFNGKITYSVEPGHGLFWVFIKPTDPENEAPYITEFNDSTTIPKPTNGQWCEGVQPIQYKQELLNLLSYAQTSVLNPILTNPTNPKGLTTPITNPATEGIDFTPTDELLPKTPQQLVGKETVTVEPGWTVYFRADQPGDDAITVQTNCTTSQGCIKTFDIAPEPVTTCAAADLITTHKGETLTQQCLEAGLYSFTSNFYEDAAKQTPLTNNIQVKWTTTDPNGEFFSTATVIPGQGTKGTFIDDSYVFYKGGGQVTTSLYSINGETYGGPICKSLIEPCEEQETCTSLEFTTSKEQINIEELPTFLDLISSTTQGNKLPDETKIVWKTDTNGQLNIPISGAGTVPFFSPANATYSQTPVEIQNAQTTGTVSISLDPSDPYYSPACTDSIEVIECVDLTVTYQTKEKLTELSENQLYFVTGSAEYSDPTYNDYLVTYAISDSTGSFVKFPKTGLTNLDNAIKNAFYATLTQIDKVTKTSLENLTTQLELQFADPNLNFEIVNTIQAKPNEVVTLVTFTNIDIQLDTALTAAIIGTNNCIEAIPYTPPETPLPVCEDLQIIQPDRPWTWDGEGNEQIFRIDIKPAENATKFTYHWEVDNGDGEWTIGEDPSNPEDADSKYLVNRLRNYNEDTEVTVWAIDKDGNRIPECEDSINIRTEEEPEIEKTVYPQGHPEDADDLLNIGKTTKYLTYQIGFKSGSADYAELTEETFTNGVIEGDRTINGEKGELTYTGGMRINVIDGNDEYTIFKTNDYDKDKGDKGFDESDDYENEFSCDSADKNDNRVCIDTNFNEIENRFITHNSLKFEIPNEDTKIIIKFQVENNSVITGDICEDLDSDDGCGEEFPNKASFEAYKEDEDGNKTNEDTGYDRAKVIVICPFILTRTGGDVFFYDALDTGIDVAQCSEVKGTPGTIVTPIPEENRDLTSTGQGNLNDDAITLDLPSHDVCRYSNQDKNIEGYNNVLKNFSSTICELKAEVAKNWTEENINNSIEANIQRIARFEGNLKDLSKITGPLSLQNVPNAENGVFYKDNGDLTLSFGSDIPVQGAQTYIVHDHDVTITNNIKVGEANFLDPTSVESIAIIVIDGNIIIENDVEEIDAILMAVDFKQEGKGKITNTKSFNEENKDTTTQRLTINGSLIGNVYELFATRVGVGDPTKDEGSVTIKYDERVLLNPPPGLNELININQSIVPQ